MTPLSELIAKLQSELEALQQQAADNAGHLAALEAEDLEDPSDLTGAALIRAINALDIRKPQHARELEAALAAKIQLQKAIAEKQVELAHRLEHQQKLDDFFILAKEANQAFAAAAEALDKVSRAGDELMIHYSHRMIFSQNPLDTRQSARIPQFTLHPQSGKLILRDPQEILSTLRSEWMKSLKETPEITEYPALEELQEAFGAAVGLDGHEIYEEEPANA